MRKPLAVLKTRVSWAVALLHAFVGCAVAQAMTLDVTPTTGFDDALRQVARLRTADPDESVVIRVAAGDYFVTNGICIDAGSAPRSGCGTLLIESTGGARLHGGMCVKNWRRETFNGRDGVWSVDVPGFAKRKQPRLFVCGGRKMEWARYPNADSAHPYSGGWAYVEGKRVGMHEKCAGADRTHVQLAEVDRRVWSTPEDGVVCLFPQFNWIKDVKDVRRFDSDAGRIEVNFPFRYEVRPGNRFCVYGMREELDAAGEWWCGDGTLRFIPPEGVDPRRELCVLPGEKPVFDLQNATRVTIRGFEITAATLGVRMRDCASVTIEGCRIHDLGFFDGSGVSGQAVTDCSVVDCDIWNVGKHGVGLTGGDSRTLEKSGNRVENCYVHHCGQVDRHGIGVWVWGQGATVRHCLLHDMPRGAIFHTGRLHTIEYNVIRHTNLETEDTGAIYGGGWTCGAGTEIRHNRISDTIGFVEREGKYKFHFFASGIHLDEAIGGVSVYGNLIERSNLAAFNLHNARYVTISNNVLVANAGKNGWLWQMQIEGWNSDTNGYFMTSRRKDISREWHELVDAQPAWTNFPSLAQDPDRPFNDDGSVMRGIVVTHNVFYYPDQPKSHYARLRNWNFNLNRFARNMIWCGTGKWRVSSVGTGDLGWADWNARGQDAGSVLADPKFMDPTHGDWRFAADSRMGALDVVPLKLEAMGLKPTPWRPFPLCEAEGVREHPEWLTLPEGVLAL